VDAASAQNGPHVPPPPVGIAATGTRTNRDSLGSMEAPAEPCRGALTHPGSGPGQPGTDSDPSSGTAGRA